MVKRLAAWIDHLTTSSERGQPHGDRRYARGRNHAEIAFVKLLLGVVALLLMIALALVALSRLALGDIAASVVLPILAVGAALIALQLWWITLAGQWRAARVYGDDFPRALRHMLRYQHAGVLPSPRGDIAIPLWASPLIVAVPILAAGISWAALHVTIVYILWLALLVAVAILGSLVDAASVIAFGFGVLLPSLLMPAWDVGTWHSVPVILSCLIIAALLFPVHLLTPPCAVLLGRSSRSALILQARLQQALSLLRVHSFLSTAVDREQAIAVSFATRSPAPLGNPLWFADAGWFAEVKRAMELVPLIIYDLRDTSANLKLELQHGASLPSDKLIAVIYHHADPSQEIVNHAFDQFDLLAPNLRNVRFLSAPEALRLAVTIQRLTRRARISGLPLDAGIAPLDCASPTSCNCFRAWLLELMGDHAAARTLVSDALQLDANHLTAIRSMARLDSKRGESARALEAYERMLASRGDDPYLLLEVGEAFARGGQPEAALKELQLAATACGRETPMLCARMAAVLLNLDQHAQADRWIARGLAIDATDVWLLAERIASQMRNYKFAGAQWTLQRATSLHPDDDVLTEVAIYVRHLNLSYGAAEQSIAVLEESTGPTSRTGFWRAVVAAGTKQWELAAMAWDRVLAFDAGWTTAVYGRAHALVNLGRLPEARALCAAVTARQGLEQDLAHGRAIMHAASMFLAEATDQFLELGLSREACDLLERAAALSERTYGTASRFTSDSLDRLGRCLRESGDLENARKHLERAVQIDERVQPRSANIGYTYHHLAQALSDAGLANEARAAFERSLAVRERYRGKNHVETADTLHELGRLFLTTGDLLNAREAFERAVKIRKSRLGATHWRTLQSLAALAEVFAGQGDAVAARPGP